jgi:hypothetical protein
MGCKLSIKIIFFPTNLGPLSDDLGESGNMDGKWGIIAFDSFAAPW